MVQVNLTMGFALHYGLFCALLASLIRSSVFTHSLISLLIPGGLEFAHIVALNAQHAYDRGCSA